MHLTKSPPPPTPPTQMQSEKKQEKIIQGQLRPDEPTTSNSVIMTGTLTSVDSNITIKKQPTHRSVTNKH